MQRIVITGIGIISSIGNACGFASNAVDAEPFWTNLLNGHSGISPVQSFDTSALTVANGGEIRDFEPTRFVSLLNPQEMGRASQLAIAAARLAIQDSGVDVDSLLVERCGVSMGTTTGEADIIEKFDDRLVAGDLTRVGSGLTTQYPSHLIPANVAAELEFHGINTMIPTACAAGSYAIGHAFDSLRSGRSDLMLAGGTDGFSRITYSGFAKLGAIASEKVQPFDKNRGGMIPGEGAAILVLEPLPAALKRGARIYAEIAGYGLSCDAHHITTTHPEGDGARRAMEKALHQAKLDSDAISYISAHGTGTIINDRSESVAVQRVFGDRPSKVPISSIKSMLGHTMGAASAIEAAVCAFAIADNCIPPTINYEQPDPECDVDCVPNEARQCDVRVTMNNAYAFGGNNSSMIFKDWEG